MEAAPKARHPHGEQVSGTIPGHHHPIELNLSGFALSHPSLCKSMHRVCSRAFYVLRMQRDEERVNGIEGCLGLPAVGLAAPHRGLRVARRAAG